MKLFFRAYGHDHARPLIILHGLLGSSDNWHTHARRFGKQLRVFALDLRDHGRSPHTEDFNYAAMRDDVREFMQQQGLKSTCLLGHSMGGKVAMHVAVAYPHLVEKLVIVDIAPRAYQPNHLELLRALRVADFSSRAEVEASIAPAIPKPAIRQFLLKNLVRHASGHYRWRMNLDVIARNYMDLTQAVPASHPFDGPALFIRGGRASYVLDSDLKPIGKMFPRHHLVTIPHAGHWVHADAPEEFSTAVLDFLAR